MFRWPIVVFPCLLLALLIYATPFSVLADIFEKFQISVLFPALVFFTLSLLFRSFRLRTLSHGHENRSGHGSWMRLAARHQFFFTVLPSGFGDFSYPFLAKKTVGCPPTSAASAIMTYRSHDLAMLAIMASFGLVMNASSFSVSPLSLVPIFAFSFMLLFLAHDLIRLFATLPLIVLRPCSGSRSTNMGRLYWLFQEFRCRCSEAKITNEQRIVAAALTILSWAAASVAVWFVFSALGENLEPSIIVLLVAGLNFIGRKWTGGHLGGYRFRT